MSLEIFTESSSTTHKQSFLFSLLEIFLLEKKVVLMKHFQKKKIYPIKEKYDK